METEKIETEQTKAETTEEIDGNKADTAETKVESTAQKPARNVNLGKLLERERAAARKEQELKAKEEQYKKYAGLENTFKENPLQAIKDLGVSFEEVAKQYLNDGQVDANTQIQNLLKQEREERIKLQKEHESLKKELKTKEEQAQFARDKAVVTEYISRNKDIYELIDTFGEEAQQTIITAFYDAINLTEEEREQHYEKIEALKEQGFTSQNDPLTFEGICDLVEYDYELKLQARLHAIKNSKKARKYFGIEDSPPAPAKEQSKPTQKKPTSALRVSSNSSSAITTERSKKPLTQDEHDQLARDLWKKLQREKAK